MGKRGAGAEVWPACWWRVLRALFLRCSENCTQVILDVRSNPGGYLEYLFGVMESLFGTDKTNTTGFSYQSAALRLRADTPIPYLMAAANVSVWDWEFWADENEVPYTAKTGGNFFKPTQVLQFGRKAVRGRYSKAFTDNSPRLADQLGYEVKSVLGKKKLALLSDGHCFSACGSFTFALRYRLDAKLVTIGGIPGTPLQFCGGAGSPVLFDMAREFWNSAPISVLSRPDAPGLFYSRNVQLGMAFAFSQQKGVPVPIEFGALTGDLSLDYSPESIADPFSIWVKAAEVFA